jgi:hypothetical protein
MLGEFGRIMGGAPARRGHGRRRDDASHVGVLCRCGQREMTGPQCLVSGHVRQRQMKRPSLSNPRMPPGRHGNQWMPQPNPLTVRDQQPGSHKFLHRHMIGDRLELGQAQVSAQCRDKQGPVGRPWQLRHACPERVTSKVRDRRFGADRPRFAPCQRPAKLQREQWVPLRHVEQPDLPG